MVSESDLHEWVIVSGDPGVPEGTIGVLVEVFSDCAAIETPPRDQGPDGDVWIAALGAVSRAEGVPAETRARVNKTVIFRDRLGFTTWEEVSAALMAHAQEHDGVVHRRTKYGDVWYLDGPMRGAGGRVAPVRTAWMIHGESQAPVNLTAFLLPGGDDV